MTKTFRRDTPVGTEVTWRTDALETVEDGLREQSAVYLTECGLSIEEAAEAVAREFELSELDLLWLACQAR